MKLPTIAAVMVGSTVFLALLGENRALADPIIPELGSQTQVVRSQGEFTITGGVASVDGQALFHSFEQLGLSQGEVATFLSQPGVQSILGRVVGGNASYIDGLLRVSGSAADLYLINPAGILFGPNAQLDLSGSFAATTANGIQFEQGIFDAIAPNDYAQLAGNPVGFVFTTAAAGAIVNAGHLAVSPGESLTLMGGQVISTGTLTAPGGEVTIAAIPGANLVRISHPDMLLSLELATMPADSVPGTPFTPLSLPELLTGGGADLATGLVVQPDGSVALVNQETVLPHGLGTAIAAGTLDVAGAVGGAVTVVGDRVALVGATVNASGEQGAGTVRLGGDFQGLDTLPGSQLTYVDAETTLTANGGLTGNGGRVILWSDGATAFFGEIVAAGGAIAGDGGFVEVSGQQALVFRGMVKAIAPNGQIGQLLLDPTDITIRAGTADGDDLDPSAFQLINFNIAAAAAIPTVIYESELESSPGNIDLGIRASNNIIIEDLADNELTFFSDPVTPGSITFEAGNEFRMVDVNDAMVAPRRSLTITAGSIVAGTLDTSSPSDTGGNIGLSATGAIAVGDVITQGNVIGDRSGDVTITGSSIRTGQIDAGGGFSDTSRVELTATSGDIVVDTITAGGGGLTIDAARRFQAVETFNANVRITLDSSTDAALIDFLMKGDPQPLIDAGLIDTVNQVLFLIPASILVSPEGGSGPIVIRHGGTLSNLSDGNITIIGTGAFPDIQFVAGPNNDHAIAIDPAIPFANFTGFTTLFPPGTFPAEASGTTGAILRGQGDATLVTSFQNQPFVPIEATPEINPPPSAGGGIPTPGGGTTNPGSSPNPGDGAGSPSVDGGTGATDGPDAAEGTTTELENLADEDDRAIAEAAAAPSSVELTTEADADQECRSTVVNQSEAAVEIETVCEVAAPEEVTP